MEAYIYIKNTLTSFILCFSLFANAQSEKLEKLNQSNTLYIYIFKNKDVDKVSNNILNSDNFNYFLWFEFDKLPKKNLLLVNHYSFALNKKVCKKFLKQNEDIIVDFDFLKSLGYDAAEKLLSTKKQLYLIDDEDVGWFKVKLREVKMADKTTLISVE